MRPIHLLLATVEDPHDPRSWSGTAFHLRQALEASFERVTVLSSPRPQRGLLNTVPRAVLGRQRYPLWITPTALRAYARRLEQAMATHQPDAVLCVSSQHLVHLKPASVPVFMFSDAPWMAYMEAYTDYDPLPLRGPAFAREEAAAARRITGVVYPSPWACNEAKQRFGLSADRVHLIPMGANQHCTLDDDAVAGLIARRGRGTLQLLFIGKDWERKGGPYAVEVVRQLRIGGVDARLTVIGCHPPLSADDSAFVTVHGFLASSVPADREKLTRAFEQADFFILPSRAECYGLVFAEAQSYGLPCLGFDAHGVPGVVAHGETGLLFPKDRPAKDTAVQIAALVRDRDSYTAMAAMARQRYLRDLNWAAFGRQLGTLVHDALALTSEK